MVVNDSWRFFSESMLIQSEMTNSAAFLSILQNDFQTFLYESQNKARPWHVTVGLVHSVPVENAVFDGSSQTITSLHLPHKP